MALPNSIDSTTPPGSQSPSLGDDRIREFKTAVEDILGIIDATNIATAAFSITADGLNEIIMFNAAANATASGRIRRNATNLTFHDGTSARTIAFLERNQTFDPGSQSGTTSVQAVAGDLTLAAGYGTSISTAPVYAAGVMGNVLGSNLTASQNMIAGVIGKYDITGTNASVLFKAGIAGEVGDNADSADAAVMAVLGGDTAATNPAAAFGVMFLNSTLTSNFGFGLDLYRAAIGNYQPVSYGTAAIRVPNAAWIVGRNAAGSANVNLIRLDSSDLVAFGANLSSPTIVTPTIASFANATHNHEAAAGGGTLAAAALSDGTSGTGAFVRQASPSITTPTIASFVNANHNHQDAAGGGVVGGVSVKAGQFTRDTSLASGTQVITGVGFLSKGVIFMAAESGTDEVAFGLDGNADAAYGVFDDNGASAGNWVVGGGNTSISMRENGSGTSYDGEITTLGSDGFTITWSKSGSPTGTATISYMAIG